MTKYLLDLHREDELKNFAANNLGVFKLRIRIRATVSHVLGSRALERGTVTIEQVDWVLG